MNLTITQAIERTRDLSGELKAARTAKADCAADVEAKDRLAEIARKALTNAEDHEARLIAEREELADHIAALVRKTGEAVELSQTEKEWQYLETGVPIDGPMISKEEWERQLAENPPVAVGGLNSIFTEGADFRAQLLENAESRVNGAFERATQ